MRAGTCVFNAEGAFSGGGRHGTCIAFAGHFDEGLADCLDAGAGDRTRLDIQYLTTGVPDHFRAQIHRSAGEIDPELFHGGGANP